MHKIVLERNSTRTKMPQVGLWVANFQVEMLVVIAVFYYTCSTSRNQINYKIDKTIGKARKILNPISKYSYTETCSKTSITHYLLKKKVLPDFLCEVSLAQWEKKPQVSLESASASALCIAMWTRHHSQQSKPFVYLGILTLFVYTSSSALTLFANVNCNWRSESFVFNI